MKSDKQASVWDERLGITLNRILAVLSVGFYILAGFAFGMLVQAAADGEIADMVGRAADVAFCIFFGYVVRGAADE